jgi:hypothetical protein
MRNHACRRPLLKSARLPHSIDDKLTVPSTFIAGLELAKQGDVALGQGGDFDAIHVAPLKVIRRLDGYGLLRAEVVYFAGAPARCRFPTQKGRSRACRRTPQHRHGPRAGNRHDAARGVSDRFRRCQATPWSPAAEAWASAQGAAEVPAGPPRPVCAGLDTLPYDRARPSRRVTGTRVASLASLVEAHDQPILVLTTPEALPQRVPRAERVRERSVRLAAGDELDLEWLWATLVAFEYVFDDRVDEPGEAAIRAGAVDIHSAGQSTRSLELDQGRIAASGCSIRLVSAAHATRAQCARFQPVRRLRFRARQRLTNRRKRQSACCPTGQQEAFRHPPAAPLLRSRAHWPSGTVPADEEKDADVEQEEEAAPSTTAA